DQVFRKFKSRLDPGLSVGRSSLLDGVLFNVGELGCVQIGDECRLEEVFLISELAIRIGNGVVIGWRATIVDSDFHPVAPRERAVDVVAISPLHRGTPRPPLPCKPVIIEDDVWIGPNVTILKGVQIGAGAFIEPGAVVVRDVPARARVLGNPAQVIGEV
ncbi:MAG TPA: acyltransferase, partial [Polyangiales bacterium]|nr:acyltransferase [Polyangiales bacterium]